MSSGVSIYLPNELLLKIFSYLSSNEILRLYLSCDNKYLKSILTDREIIKCVDFCKESSTADNKDLRKFLSACAQSISSLCLNHCHCKFVPPKTFFQSFNSLTELHVKDCGFPVYSIVQQVPELKSLQAFSCSIVQGTVKQFACFEKNPLKVSESIRRLNVDIHLTWQSFLHTLLYQFSKVTHLHINLFSLSDSSIMWISSNVPKKLELENLHTFTLSVIGVDSKGSTSNMYLSLPYCSALSLISCRNKTVKWQRLEAWEDHNFGKDLVESQPPKTKHCVFVPYGLVQTEMDLVRLEDMMHNDAGDKVRMLFLNNISVSQSFQFQFMTWWNMLVSLCKNLTEINLAGTHNTHPLGSDRCYTTMLDTISTVHGLKRLVIPGCCICPLTEANGTHRKFEKRLKLDFDNVTMNKSDDHRKAALSKLAEGCPGLIELDIRNTIKSSTAHPPCSCDSPQKGLKDVDLAPVLKNQKLEDLTLKGLKTVVKLEFLKNLSEKCPFIKTLRLVDLGPQGMCLYWTNLVQAFSSMKNLQELSIEHNQLPLDQRAFWLDLERIPSLIRLCIISRNFSGSLQPLYIMKFILLVTTLRMLHIHSMARNFKTCASTLSRDLKNTKVDILIGHMNHLQEPIYSGNFYEHHRMCFKGSTVGILRDTCGLGQK